MPLFDLFISYRRKDADRVVPLVDALRARGLHVWLDQHDISDFAAITGEIRTALANSKALLAWYSTDYPRSRPCQMELTAAFIAAQQVGDPRQRVLVINPEENAAHVLPVQLVDEQHLSAGDVRDLAARIAAHVSTLQGPLGALLLQPPPQYPRPLVGAARFIGRRPDLWQLHSALTASDSAIISQSYGPGLALVSGLGGAGKSLLAEEYALRFAAAYPGGIFWFRALGNDGRRPALSAEDQEAVRSEQWRNVAIALDLSVQGLNPAEVDAALARKLREAGASFLWVVDDLAAGLDAETVRRWLAPAPPGRTLITTRSREYGAIGNPKQHVALDMLDPTEADDLLRAWRVPKGTAEEEAARALAQDLGFHPLALEVAGAALKADEGLQTFAQFRTELSNPSHDELELAADPQIVGMLPSGHEPSVAGTLLRSIRGLGPEGQDFLRLAASLAVAAIPASLVRATFAHVDGLDEQGGRHRARLALAQTDRASLTTDAGEGARMVHALVSRSVRFQDPDTVRGQTLYRSAIAALNKALAAVTDIRSHASIVLDVLHARDIAARGLGGAESATLAGWVARYDFERGAYAAARALYERALDLRRPVLGDEHPDTLTSMNDLAVTLKAQGDRAGARRLHEKVLDRRRRVLGQEHPDTLESMNNVAATLGA